MKPTHTDSRILQSDQERLRPALSGAIAMVAMIVAALGCAAGSAKAETPQSATSRIVGAANAFLSTLNDKQRAGVLYRFDDGQQRARWSNFPTGFVPRGGLKLGDLTEDQKKAAMALLASSLSAKGYEKVEEIREADDAFKAIAKQNPPPGARNGPPRGGNNGGPPPDSRNGGPGGPPPGALFGNGPEKEMFGKDLYYISILGVPSEKAPWMLQFGGHHLALNITIIGQYGVATPSLTGAQPGTYVKNGKTYRPLGRENDKGFALLAALDDSQRKKAILGYRVADLVLGPGHDGEKIQPEGLQVSEMNRHQKELLLDLISEWSGIVNDSFAVSRMNEIETGLNETWFAWSGPTTAEPGKNGSSYYRIQGPKLIIEYAPQPGEDHVHTIYRDPTDDYGVAIAATP